MAGEPTIAELFREALESRLFDLHTALPGRVRSYDKAKQVAEIEPVVKRALPRVDDSVVLETIPPIPNVPVAWPRGGGFYLAFPLEAGDEGMLVFSEAAMGAFRETRQVSEPGDRRRHSLSYGCFIPFQISHGEVSDSHANGESVLVVPIGKHLRVSTKDASADYVAIASKVDALFQAIADALGSATPAPPAGADAGEPGFAAFKSALASLPAQSTASTTLKAEG